MTTQEKAEQTRRQQHTESMRTLLGNDKDKALIKESLRSILRSDEATTAQKLIASRLLIELREGLNRY